MSSDNALAAAETAPIDGDPRPGLVRRRLLLVTGLAGAGRSTALKCLEDHGFEAVDNLPLALLPHLVSAVSATGEAPQRLAIGIDSRTRDFEVDELRRLLNSMRSERGLEVQLLFLDCDDETLRRRFSETRRRHPLAPDRPVSDGIVQERRLMLPLQQVADLVIDTSDRTVGDFKSLLAGELGLDGRHELAITVISFSYRLGLPREADLVFDVRFLDNPHYDPELRPLTGEDERVGRKVEADPAFQGFFAGMAGLLLPLLPGFEREGKSYLTIAIGCTGGRHRSVHVARRLAQWLEAKGRRATLRHRDLDRSAPESGLVVVPAAARDSGRG
ncbi:MAG TPA: RNase adapter RapZ [Candidatus Cybelea sp.]|nr:RNase adapter RapZ [Candidatus Cybelea sp.]